MKDKMSPKTNTKRRMTLQKQEALLGWLFISPALIGFGIFTFGSMLYSLYLSFTDYNLMAKPNLVGLSNYARAFKQDQYFYPYFGNTLFFVITLVPIVLVFSLALALLINKKTGMMTKFYRVALFLPSITSTVAISMVWIWIFNPDMGIMNNILYALGVQNPPMWLSDPKWSKPALVIMRVWQMGGYYMLMFLTGLKTIPENLYEAANMDGATPWQKLTKITLPMLANTTFVVVIMLVIEAFNMFESIFIMTQGGPVGSTSTIMYYIYEQGFMNYNMGYASALAWIFFALIMIVTMIQYRFRNEQEG
ncbi:MAG: sugar ABC transporter permease [Spirochaetales bacterium]|nr:sugar ABC transporter permease [Spirochaetales bacterium]